MTIRRSFPLALGLLIIAVGPAAAAVCGSGPAGFDRWLADFRREAAAAGIKPQTIAGALDGVTYDQGVINSDRGQGVFQQSFLQFSDRMVAAYRIQRGGVLIKQHAATFARVQKEFGVPAAVIVGFWGLETDFGANTGKVPVIGALATLAYDCRRPEKFRPQLLDALRIVERGDLRPAEMIGAWAGELGQTQFQPADYMKAAVDYDGDGRRDLLRSVPDVLASSANLLRQHGWKPGQPWLEEVRAPANTPWAEADLAVRHPRSQWARIGVTYADGRPLPADATPAALLLPMGRHGPAFLAYENFDVYTDWNQSLVYATTAAYYATRLAGAPAFRRPTTEIPVLGRAEMIDLQNRLTRMGHDVGKVDGIAGAQTRAAVKAVQQKLGLPADSYPTPELLARLRTGP